MVSSSLKTSDEFQAGFYAIACKVTDGSAIDGLETGDVIISYRGTDNFTSLDAANDIWSGWTERTTRRLAA